MSAQQTMMGLVYQGNGTLSLQERPVPTILSPKDAVLRVTRSAICTSDLHIKNGAVPRAKEGVILGHESLSGSSPKSARMSTILQSATASQQTASPSAVIAGSAARAISITANRADGNLAAASMAVRQNLSVFRLRIWDFAKSPTAFRMRMPCFWVTSFPADILVRSLPKSPPAIPLRSSVQVR